MKESKSMLKEKKKSEKIEVCMTENQKRQLRKLAELANKSMSEFILEAALNIKIRTPDDSFHDLAVLLTKHFKAEKSFQKQQQITMYMIMQFSLYLASFTKDREEIMEFYEDIYRGAIEKFGDEDE